MGEAGPRFEPVAAPVKKLEQMRGEEFEAKKKQFMEAAERARELFIREREMRAAYRRQSQPLWQYEAEQLPQAQREQLSTFIEEVISKEENTELEVAAEEAQKMHEDIQELISEKKVKTYTEACATVVERKEYQLKSEKRIEKEEAIRPYVLYVEKAIKQDTPRAAREMIKIMPPNRKAELSAVPEIFDRIFDKKEREYVREGKADMQAELLATRVEVTNVFDIKTLEKMDAQTRKSPVFIEAAKKFLQNKLVEVTNFFGATEIKEYIWMREKLIKSGTLKADEIDEQPAVQWKLTTILIGHSPEDKIIFLEHVERYQYLKNQMEVAGILEKNESNEDPRVQEAFFALLDNSFEKKENLSDQEIFARYSKIRARMAEYKILGKAEIDRDLKIQKNLRELLLRQLSAQTSNKEKLNNFLGFYQSIVQEEMLPPEEQKKMGQDEKLMGKIQTTLAGALEESPAEEKQARYIEFRQRVGVTGLATYAAIDRWNVLGEGVSEKKAA